MIGGHLHEMTELKGKIIAITGGTGTIGRSCVQHIYERYPDAKRIVIFSRDEMKQLEMMEEYPEDGPIPISYHLGDVRDVDRMRHVFAGVDCLIHAAAIKHVVMAEKNPEECFKTNEQGTANVIEVCKKNEISQAILISTDKANKPIGVYGVSKQRAERLFLAEDDCFRVIRLGNVVGARGSVFEVFEKQRRTGVLKVTHPDATRFYIPKEKAAEAILAGLLIPGSQRLFTPPMKSIRIVDLARQIAPECEVIYTGLRPGDKLHEEINGVSSEDALLEAKFIGHGV